MRPAQIRAVALLLGAFLTATAVGSAEVAILLPLGRTAYQTNEFIDVAVVRSDRQPLPAADLVLALRGPDDATFRLTFPVPAVPVEREQARATHMIRLNGRLLAPGKYVLEGSVNDARASTTIEVFSHVRRSTFRLIDWGSRAGKQAAVLGEHGLGFNLLYADGRGEAALRGGLDFMGCCVVGGGHQADLRMECDWSDPFVLGGVRRRAARAALQYRTYPNAIGVHLYDEPGLTWRRDPETGRWTPHGIPAQVRSYLAAYGQPPPDAVRLDPERPEEATAWKQWARWKLGLMDAAWKDAQFGVNRVCPDFLAATQSQYGWFAFTDGYYYNVVRSLPVTSGHGGYDDVRMGFLTPSWYLTMARARDLAKPNWYLPTWFSGISPEAYRVEQYLSFATGIQGLAKPPDIAAHTPDRTPQSDMVVETNQVMGRLGTIFTAQSPRRPPVALLYSLSHLLELQTRDRENWQAPENHLAGLAFAYVALTMIQQPVQAVVEEDILDGTLSAHYRAVVLPGVTHLDPAVARGLEAFARDGGLVLLTGDSTVALAGAVNLGVTPRLPDAEKVAELIKAGKYQELVPYTTVGKYRQAAAPLAKALQATLDKAGIRPAFRCDQEGIVATRHVFGEVEYLFAVNATYDDTSRERNALEAATATLAVPRDGRPVYDALRTGTAEGFVAKGEELAATLRFGPGQMRVFARTARPVAGVQVAAPAVQRDYTQASAPLVVQLSAAVTDVRGGVISGVFPLRILVTDPHGRARYDLYRATAQGCCRLDLPLALNDPPGTWTVTVQDLLAGKSGRATFLLPTTDGVGALAGMVPRAVLFGEDGAHIFRMMREHKQLLIVKGASAYNEAAANRLAQVLEPWGVGCTVTEAAAVNRPRELSAEEAATWVGLDYAPSGAIKPGRDNPPELVGYDLPEAVVLLGTPEDNPLIKTLVKHQVLPYAVSADFPGPGRGLVAWQFDLLGRGIESVCLIANDARGMEEAVGTFYEAAAGIEAVTPLVLPAHASLSGPTTPAKSPPAAKTAWQVALPDRVLSVQVVGDAAVLRTWEGSRVRLEASGKYTFLPPTPGDSPPEWLRVVPQDVLAEVPPEVRLPDHLVKLVARGSRAVGIAYWGGALQILDSRQRIIAQQVLPADVAAMAWLDRTLLVALADGTVRGLVLN